MSYIFDYCDVYYEKIKICSTVLDTRYVRKNSTHRNKFDSIVFIFTEAIRSLARQLFRSR